MSPISDGNRSECRGFELQARALQNVAPDVGPKPPLSGLGEPSLAADAIHLEECHRGVLSLCQRRESSGLQMTSRCSRSDEKGSPPLPR